MKVNKIRNSCLLLLTAFIWGTAFVAQRTGGDEIGPFAFTAIRSLIAAVFLFLVVKVIDKVKPSEKKPKNAQDRKLLWKAGISCGIALVVASNLQQLGITLGAPVGKAGFLTSCYILIVPILGLFLKKKCGWNIWVGVLIALAGLFLLCIEDDYKIGIEDILLILCAFVFSIQIFLVDHYSPMVDGVRLSCIQFLVAGIISVIPMLLFDTGCTKESITEFTASFSGWNTWVSILYAAVLSSGVAYTLQIIGQNGLNPTVASLLMSCESVFSALAGWLILNEILSNKEISGCVLIFIAIILAQLQFGKKE